MARLSAALGIVLGVTLTACANPAETWHQRWGIPASPVTEILAERSCASLDAQIVTLVDEVTNLAPRGDRLERSALIQAAFHRMVELDCPQAYRK